MAVLMMIGGAMNEMWAAKVTYHILTLPIDPSYYDYNMVSAVTDHRLEALKVVTDGTTVELPAHFKSPLASNFRYYKPEDVIGHGGSAIKLYDNGPAKGVLYQVKGVDTGDSATPVAEGSAITTSNAEYYVIYSYNASNTIAQLDGSVNYNIGVNNKGFLALNRGRNNRPAVMPKGYVNPEMLSIWDFSYVDVSDGKSGVTTYWQSGDNKNKKEDTESKFFFIFKFEGKDPYHIVIRTSYAKDSTYIEKNDNIKPDKFVYKWYKEASLFAVGTANAYIASDEHILYNIQYNQSTYPINPTDLREGDGLGYTAKKGNFHGQTNVVWGTVALLNNSSNTGYVLMGTRTVDGNGALPTPSDNKYNYLKFTNNNNLNFGLSTAADVTKSHTVSGLYPIKNVTFKIVTPFYAAEPTSAHIITYADQVSQYTVDNDPIEVKYLPTSLRRKYCNFTGKFYKDAACTQEITYFSEADYDNTEGYQVYVGYELTSTIPFKAITPAATYSATTWANATWYEMTDENSTQVDGLKLKYDGTNFQNNGADRMYEKESEFAFIGDPYELRVVYRNATSGATPYYVGAAGTPPTSATLLTASTTASEGYIWEMPEDETTGSFRLRKYKGDGTWYWDAGHPDPVDVDYSVSAHTYNVATANGQTVTFNVSKLTDGDGNYLAVTVGGTNADQATVQGEKIYVINKAATFTVAIKARGDGNKQFTLTIREKNSSDGNVGTASVVTVNQNNSTLTSNAVEYNTSNATRIKLLGLPKHDYTYNIVDKSGRIAVKATANQTIFSPLSLASIPSIIISPYLIGETVTFYTTYSGGGRGNLSGPITELTAGNAAGSTNVYVKYTTSALNAKPIKLSEDEEFNVKLNGHFVYYDKSEDVLKTNSSPTDENLRSSEYLWKLRNKDPYAMLIDNMGAREDLSIAGQTETVTVYDDAGTGTSESRQKGAWVTLASIANAVDLSFTTDRASAQQFVAKASLQAGVYEVMVADGGTVDASTTYYNIGRPSDNTVKIYNNAAYAHGDDELRFVLNQNVDYQYHLIDMDKHELLTASSKTPDLALPADYQSPLVATYNFYALDQMTVNTSVTPYEYTPTDPAVKLEKITDLNAEYSNPVTITAKEYAAGEGTKKTAENEATMLAEANQLTATGWYFYDINNGASYKKFQVTRGYRGVDIYVTYTANDIVTFNTGAYMLHFLDPLAAGYYLEDGNDRLTTEKIQAVYPYCNDDGNLNIYGNEMQKEQFGGGASTRPRWVWFFDSKNGDPYHVRVRSKSTINYKSVAHSTYLTTYAVHFTQDAPASTKHVVTGGTLPGVASAVPTEYMVLGSVGHYRLLTTDKINDGLTNERRKVDSFEQYWKTYNMLKLCVLGISSTTDAYSEEPDTWVVPESLRATLNERLEAIGVGSGNWHSYDAYANATRWNGYNDKTNGAGKKVVEKLEHWYQTFSMGNGTFDIESAEIPPVLVLLDLHGWEVMRRPLPPAASYPEGEELAALRVYDSPLVEKYYFYSNATKASGCHKYSLRMQNGQERDQIKVNGEHYTSKSLADLPPRNASGVISGGAIQDFYVTYTVKEEFAHNYEYTLTLNAADTTYTETGTSQPYLILQNGRFYKYENNYGVADKKSYISKPIFEYTNPEGGNVYDMIINPYNPPAEATHPKIIDNSGNFIGNNFWYIKPNLNIDEEMGIPWLKATGETTVKAAKYKLKKEYEENGKSGFDPYNMQLQLKNNQSGTADNRFITTHMDTTRLDNGILIGNYDRLKDADTTLVTLVAAGSTVDAEGYDHTTMQITNQTFMAVSDVNGNMQLMPRFDHTKRLSLDKVNPWLSQLRDPEDHAKANVDDNESMGRQTTFFVCPQRFHYHIIDNNGREALGYKRGADFYPAVTDHFKSPLAKEYTFYKALAQGTTDDSNGGEWSAAEGDFKRTLSDPNMLTDAIKLLPTAGKYYYRLGTRGVFTWKKVTVAEGEGLLDQQITSSFAEAEVTGIDPAVYVRYEYDLDADLDADRMLQGQWYTVQLAGKDLQASGTLVTAVGETQGTGVSLYAGNSPLVGGDDENDKPATVDENEKKWQWKFFVAPADPVSDYYVQPDPYAVHLFNREANYTANPSATPSPMAVPIKVPNANNGADRFALLSHPDGGYALVVAKDYGSTYDYIFLNGEDMTIPSTTAATTASEASFTYKTAIISAHAQLLLTDDVIHHYTYYVITNDSIVAISATQDNDDARSHNFAPNLPESAQSPLLNMDDYKYYGFARAGTGTKKGVIEQTILYTLSGLYDDKVYVRYAPYDMDKTSFKVPNQRNATGTGQVERGEHSVDVSMNLNGGLPYNIIWYSDNMMQSTDNSTISDGGSHGLSGDKEYVWYFTGGDPYALKIKHKTTDENVRYLNGTGTMVDEASAPTFMLLRKSGYDYGILQITADDDRLTSYGEATTTGDPNHYIIFGLSIHDLIYHLIIANTGNTVKIDYRATESGELTKKSIIGTTQRDLESIKDSGTKHVAGEKYQLGDTLSWNGTTYTYCYDAGSVSIGDELVLPNVFSRPNCTFDFYIEGIYQHYNEANANEGKPYTELDDKYKGIKLDKLMSDEQLIDQNVVVNIVYTFDNTIATNTGLGFVTSVDENLWYTFETQNGETPYLAQYTNAWGLQSKEGRDTRYTNDYLWSPLGDVYGFKMYNRYMLKNSNGGENKVMTMKTPLVENDTLSMAEPGTGSYTTGNEIFELVSGDVDGYFRVHPVINNSGTRYYVWRDPSDNYTKLSTTPTDWRYGLDMYLLEPYYERAGYVGGLTAAGKTAYEYARDNGKITDIQDIVYNDDYIVPFSTGYYRLHNQPGVSGIDPVRYASGYLHDIEKKGKDNKAIPMHFFSRSGVSAIFKGTEDDLGSGFTETPATRGEIPIDSTEVDPSTIFYLHGALTSNRTISEATMSTQGLNVSADTMTTGAGMNYTIIDIGGATLLIADELTPATRRYFCFDQTSTIYDLKFKHDVPTDDAKWCLQPVQKEATAGNGEMPLIITTNNGGDGYYYATFYAPFDVLLPDDQNDSTYYAYTCSQWYNDGVHPQEVPAHDIYAEGKFVPAGTPVIIRVKDESGSLTLTLPSTAPSASVSCVFKGTYLEKLLPADADHDVYTLGVPMTSTIENYDRSTGDITAPLPEFATSGVGFYINATRNKEDDPLQSLWHRNNRYVLHNKIYYRAGDKAEAPAHSPEYVPVLFGDGNDEQPDSQNNTAGGGVYDILGRKVASAEEVQSGTWYQRLNPGIYIIDGKKIYLNF